MKVKCCEVFTTQSRKGTNPDEMHLIVTIMAHKMNNGQQMIKQERKQQHHPVSVKFEKCMVCDESFQMNQLQQIDHGLLICADCMEENQTGYHRMDQGSYNSYVNHQQ